METASNPQAGTGSLPHSGTVTPGVAQTHTPSLQPASTVHMNLLPTGYMTPSYMQPAAVPEGTHRPVAGFLVPAPQSHVASGRHFPTMEFIMTLSLHDCSTPGMQTPAGPPTGAQGAVF